MAAAKSRRVKTIRDKLEFLECPYVENVDELWVSELLFKPGEPRLRLLQWLLARCDPQLEELLESHQAIVSNLSDSRVGKLLFCANLLGLCADDNVDLITGISSRSTQIHFFEDLIDMLLVKEELGETHRPIHATPDRGVRRRRTLNEAAADACNYLDLLCREENLQDLFKEKIQLFPPDIEKQLGANSSENKSSKIPDVTYLASLAVQIESELKKQNKVLERLQSESSTDHDAQTVNKVSRTMSLTMSTLSQMVEGFILCYETEVRQWSGREKPLLSELGPVFKIVSLLLQKLLQVLTSLEKLKLSHLQISRVKSIDMEKNAVPFGKIALETLQDCIGILDEAVKRRTDMLNDSDSL